ncbi:unnamed protein product [Prunus brigantina]
MALKRATYTRPSGQVPAPMSRRARRSLQNPGREPGGAAVGADLGGSSKYSNENFEGRRGGKVPYVGGGLGKSYLFRLTAPPTPETARPEVGSSGRKSTARRVVSGAPPATLENPEDRVPFTPGRTHNRIVSPR